MKKMMKMKMREKNRKKMKKMMMMNFLKVFPDVALPRKPHFR
jgi:hypothetical protein